MEQEVQPTEVSTEVSKPKPKVSKELIKGQFNAELSKANYLTLKAELDALKFTPENVSIIKEKLTQISSVKKIIDANHKSGKEPYLRVVQMYDDARREMIQKVDEDIQQPMLKYKQLCVRIENEAKAVKAEEERKQRIREGMDKAIIELSNRIAAATTVAELVAVEKSIGTQKSLKAKVQEFYDEYVEKLDALTPIIKDQKAKVKAYEKEVAKTPSVSDSEAPSEALNTLQASIDENKVKAQEVALNSLIEAPIVSSPTSTVTTVKPKRSVWKWKVIDIKKLQKEQPNLVRLEVDEDAIDDMLRKLKEDKTALKNKEEHYVGSIMFFLDKQY